MAKKHRKRHSRRGYPVATLVVFESRRALLWQVFSETIRPLEPVKFVGKREDLKALYAFHEKIVDALRPALKEGIRSVILVSPPKMPYGNEFLVHVESHHLWLVKTKSPNAVSFGTLEAKVNDYDDVTILVQSAQFQAKISEITGEEANQILATLEKQLQKPDADKDAILYSLQDIERVIFARDPSERHQPQYIIFTDEYLASIQEKNRLQRLLQIAKNKSVKIRVIKADTSAGERLMQFGGITWFKKETGTG
ncbi:MAG: hypothetical protein RBG13Loki_0870 [Promethearchaeota archaeon CR_4]|nr:MAG: hypothetical protein RBG13Loki_0870 [Candidatus Lokiarchaeota archaeon CR_4]